MALPFSASADRNKEAIGDALEGYFSSAGSVLELGSGTGQHAVYLAGRFSDLRWQPTDRVENLGAIAQWVERSGLKNIANPIELDVSHEFTHQGIYGLAFSANTAHIMSLPEVADMFKVVSSRLKIGARFALYGPFIYGGKHTSTSNENFDAMLKQQSPSMGIRDKAVLDTMAFDAGLEFFEDIQMPANNRILIWRH